MGNIKVKDYGYATYVDVRVDDCNHPDDYVSLEDFGQGLNTRSLLYCSRCQSIAVPDDDNEYEWEHEK